jgi:hypothetical protein
MESEEKNQKKGRGIYLVALFGYSLGLPANVSGGKIKVNTPAIYGTNPWILGGLFTWISAAASWGVGPSKTVVYMGMGIGELNWKLDLLFGIDIGIDMLGGVSVPLYVD